MSRKTRQSVLRSKVDSLISAIQNEIDRGELKEGDFLPSELELAEQYSLSKHSVRKALDLLVNQGYVQKIPRIGNKVSCPGANPEITLRLGYYPAMLKQTDLSAMVEMFRSRHPHIQIKLIPIPFKFDDLHLMKHYLQADLIDIAMFNHQSFVESHEADSMERLLEPIESSPDIYPFLLSAFQKGAKQYAVPFTFSPVILAYNKDHFEELDLPEPDSSWTWDHLLQVAEEITKLGKHIGFYYHALSDNRWPIFLLQKNRLAPDSSLSDPAVGDERLRDAVRMSREVLSRQGVTSFLSQSDLEAEQLFGTGKITMIMTTYFGLNFFQDAPFQFDIAPLPALNSSLTLNLVVGLAVSRQCARKEEAKLLVNEFTSFDYQALIRRNTLSIPAMRKAAERGTDASHPPLPSEPSRFTLYREIIQSFRLHSELGLNGEQMNKMRNELMLYWAGISDLEQCCSNLELTLLLEKTGMV
ncbi:extracellular solute-binding protein [Paenibacillus senegalensis]|uniref:extracellular solute-binding protein n=1 Tax=Paenibacillus senegalensis TaxID=1465766 RepID=UPI00028931B4|nr:extracellular solute-binding protein [Paenibacillus senegalensis]